MRKQIEFSPEIFLNNIKDLLFSSLFRKYTNLSPIGISGHGKIGSGSVGFMTCKYHSCLEEVELLVVLILLLVKFFVCIRLKGLLLIPRPIQYVCLGLEILSAV